MHKVMKKLYRDHGHFVQLMDLLDNQLAHFNEGNEPTNLLRDVMHYVHDYADSIHHPIEDQLYQMQLAQSDEGREVMEKLLVQHQVIIAMTRDLQKAVDALKPGSGAGREAVAKAGRDFVEQQRSHMQFEENDAFPLLRQSLSDEDFGNAEGALPAEDDPLLDNNMRGRYPTLFAYLDQQVQ